MNIPPLGSFPPANPLARSALRLFRLVETRRDDIRGRPSRDVHAGTQSCHAARAKTCLLLSIPLPLATCERYDNTQGWRGKHCFSGPVTGSNDRQKSNRSSIVNGCSGGPLPRWLGKAIGRSTGREEGDWQDGQIKCIGRVGLGQHRRGSLPPRLGGVLGIST